MKSSIFRYWWKASIRVYLAYCRYECIRPNACIKQNSAVTACGVAIADHQQIHTIVNFRDRCILHGGNRVMFETLGIIGIERPDAQLLLDDDAA